MGGYTLAILGCGVMGKAVLSAIYKAPKSAADKEAFYPSKIITCNHDQQSTLEVENWLKTLPECQNNIEVISTFGNNLEAVKEASVVVLALKPFIVESVLAELKDELSKKLLISLAAGWTLAQLGGNSNRVARVMTNTPAAYGCGMAVVAHSPAVSNDDKALVSELIGHVGGCVELPEKNMDAATSLVGSGPAFVLLMLESMMEAGLQMGIPLKEAKACALKVLEGTAKMVETTGTHPSVLKHQVCTPGGTTIAGLCTMEEKGVKAGIIRGMEEAARVAASLGKKNSK